MASLTEVSIRRPVATTMVFLILVVLGIVSFRALPVDLLPEVELTQLTVRVRYPNVGPEEIEQIITDPIENEVSGLPNLERITSQSEEGSSRVRLEFARGTNIDEAANDLRAALDRLRDVLPVEADPPQIFKLDLDRVEVVSLAVTSTRDLEELTRLLERDLARRFRLRRVDLLVRLELDRIHMRFHSGRDLSQIIGQCLKPLVQPLAQRAIGLPRRADFVAQSFHLLGQLFHRFLAGIARLCAAGLFLRFLGLGH